MKHAFSPALYIRRAIQSVILFTLLFGAMAATAQTRRLEAIGNMQRWNEDHTFGVVLLMNNVQISEGDTIISTDPSAFNYYEFDVTTQTVTLINVDGPFQLKKEAANKISFTTRASRQIVTGTVAEDNAAYRYDRGELRVTMTDNRVFGDNESAPDQATVEYIPDDSSEEGNFTDGDFIESGFTITETVSTVDEVSGSGSFEDESGTTVDFSAQIKSTTQGSNHSLQGTVTLSRKVRSGMTNLTLLSTTVMNMSANKKAARLSGRARVTDAKGKQVLGNVTITLSDGSGSKRPDTLKVVFQADNSRNMTTMETSRIRGDISIRRR